MLTGETASGMGRQLQRAQQRGGWGLQRWSPNASDLHSCNVATHSYHCVWSLRGSKAALC